MRHKPGFPAAPPASLSAANLQGARQPASVHFNISRITLHGYTTSNQRRFTHSLQRSLAEFVEAHHSYDWSNAKSLKIRKMSGVKLNPGASPEEAAVQIARQIVQQALPLSGGRHDA